MGRTENFKHLKHDTIASMYNTLEVHLESLRWYCCYEVSCLNKKLSPQWKYWTLSENLKDKNKWKIPLNFILQRLFATMKIGKGIIHLVSFQNFPKNKHFLFPDTQKYVYVSGGKKCWLFEKLCKRTKLMIPNWDIWGF